MNLSSQCSIGSLVRIINSDETPSECALFKVVAIEKNGYRLLSQDDEEPIEPFIAQFDEFILLAN